MVRVISAQERQIARRNLEIVKSNIQEYQKRIAQLNTQKVLRQMKRLERQKLIERNLRGMHKEISDEKIFHRLSQLPTREEYAERRRNQFERNLRLAKRFIANNVPTAFLTGEVRRIVESYRSQMGYREKLYSQGEKFVYVSSPKTKTAKIKSPTIRSHYSNIKSPFNITAQNITRKKTRIDWFK
jgi:hypothetical protein